MATNICFYTSTIPSSVLLMEEYKYKCNSNGDTLTLKDTAAVNTATLTTYCGNLAAIYTEIFVACPCEASAETTPDATLNLVNQAVLYGKLISASVGTLTAESAVADTHTTTTIGNTAMAAASALVGTPDSPIYVLTTAGTGSGQLSTIKSNTTAAVTIYGVFYAEVDQTTKYKIVTAPKLYIVGQAQVQSGTVTKNRSELGWTAMYPLITLPLINSYYAGIPGYALKTSTNTSACGAKTLTDTSLSSGTTEWVGYWVVLYDGTAYGYQYGQIHSHTTTVATLEANWPLGAPTGTGKVYRIYGNEKDCLADIYFNLWFMTNCTAAATNSTQMGYLTKLIDANGALANSTAYKQTFQDLGYLAEVLAIGKSYLNFVQGGVSIAIPT